MKNIYLGVYRTFGFAFLAGISATIFGFFALMLFFAFNGNWIAPTYLSPSSDKMLAFNNAYQQALGNVVNLTATRDEAVNGLALAKQQFTEYSALEARLHAKQGQMFALAGAKSKDLTATRQIDVALRSGQSNTQAALKAGLISTKEAAEQQASAQGFHNSLVDSQVSVNAALFGGISGLTQTSIQRLQASEDIRSAQNKLNAAEQLLQPAQSMLHRLRQSAYYQAYKSGGADLAFVPYDNLDGMNVGQPVYACYLLVVACYQVGTVGTIYSDEQNVEFPVFNVKFSRTMRGTILGLKIDRDERNAMGYKLLYVGRKPLFI